MKKKKQKLIRGVEIVIRCEDFEKHDVDTFTAHEIGPKDDPTC